MIPVAVEVSFMLIFRLVPIVFGQVLIRSCSTLIKVGGSVPETIVMHPYYSMSSNAWLIPNGGIIDAIQAWGDKWKIR